MKGRGIDFEHRFRTSRWAEDLLIASLSKDGLLAVRFGLSVIRTKDELSKMDIADSKEPDLLVFEASSLTTRQKKQLQLIDLENTHRQRFKKTGDLAFVFRKACAAIEVEFSPYRASEMKGRKWTPRTTSQWKRRPLKHANPPTAPNIFIKEEDLGRLENWEKRHRVRMLVVHLFDQEGFAVRLREVVNFERQLRSADKPTKRRLQMTQGIFRTIQVYERTDAQGAKEQKPVFRVTPATAVKVGDLSGIKVKGQIGLSASKKYVSHVLFSGGKLKLTPEFERFIRR